MKNYPDQQSDMAVAEQRGYALLGGSEKTYRGLKEAITEAIPDLKAKFKKVNVQEEFPKEFQVPKKFEKELSEGMSFDYGVHLWMTNELIKLLKKKGTLRKSLGQKEEERLYDDFNVYKERLFGLPYNPISFVGNCLKVIRKEMNDNETELTYMLSITDNVIIREAHLRKKESMIDWTKTLETLPHNKHADIFNVKMLSGRTAKEEIIHYHTKELQKTLDEMEFDNRMLNLAYTAFIEKRKRNPSFSEHKVSIHMPKKKMIEHFAGETYSKLTTYQKNKVAKMVNDKQPNTFTFLCSTQNGELEFIHSRLIDTLKEKVMPDGELEIVFCFDVRQLVPLTDKGYVYCSNKDFKLCRQNEKIFWRNLEQNWQKPGFVGNLFKKVGEDRLHRVKNNGALQATPMRLLNYLKGRYYPDTPVRLGKPLFNRICGDISNTVKSLNFIGNRPAVAEGTIQIINYKTLWVGEKSGWWTTAKMPEGKDGENGVFMLYPKRSYFEKRKAWQDTKNLSQKA